MNVDRFHPAAAEHYLTAARPRGGFLSLLCRGLPYGQEITATEHDSGRRSRRIFKEVPAIRHGVECISRDRSRQSSRAWVAVLWFQVPGADRTMASTKVLDKIFDFFDQHTKTK
jgi:hypothetical protein